MRIVVIGGGISGLACAWRLQRMGVPVLLLEQAERVGGVIQSVRRDGVLFEAGPQSFLLNPALAELVREAGLENEVLTGDARAARYVLLGGKLVRAPMSPLGLLSSGLLSWSTKKRLFGEPFGKTSPPEQDESIAAFVRRKFGAELLDRMVAPMVGGIFAGDPERLSLRAAFPAVYEAEKTYGSVIRGMMKARKTRDSSAPRARLAALRDGNETLAARLAEKLGAIVRTRARVVALRRVPAAGGGRGAVEETSAYEVECDVEGRRETIPARAVVIATPTRAAAALLVPLAPAAATELARIEYAAVAVVGTSYSREHLKQPLDGFGFLAPRSERVRVLGTVFNSCVFPGRAPEEQTMLTSFVGGVADPSAAGLPDEPLYQTVEAELRRVLGIFFRPVTRFAQRWPQAIPQYGLGHRELIARVREGLAAVPGVFLAGNYLDGPSVGACVETANRVAEVAAKSCRQRC